MVLKKHIIYRLMIQRAYSVRLEALYEEKPEEIARALLSSPWIYIFVYIWHFRCYFPFDVYMALVVPCTWHLWHRIDACCCGDDDSSRTIINNEYGVFTSESWHDIHISLSILISEYNFRICAFNERSMLLYIIKYTIEYERAMLDQLNV